MNKITSLVILLLLSATTFAQSTIFSSGESWKYYDAGNQPANDGEGDTWKEIDFDDSTWSTGNAELGYGDGDETTVISSSALTGYFRKTFSASAIQIAFADLDLNLTYDDGAVVYLNGVEVWRVNMPGGAINYGSLASSTIGDNAFDTTTIANSLILGNNTIAVEVHQVSSGSSDVSFDLELIGNAATDFFIVDTDVWKYLDDGSNQGTAWYGTGFDDSSWASGAAQLGYGDGDETTVLSYGSDSNNKHITTYFRKTINVTDHTIYSDITLEALRDDGMVVYINGVEVWRDNISGTIDYTTEAIASIGGTEETTWITKTIANNLVTGTNIIAVEIHQKDGTSSDISFNFRLTANGVVPAELERGPYLQKGTDSKVTIKYRTNTSTETIINYGTSLGSLSSVASDMTAVIDHEIELTGLTPNTKYYYEIADNDGVIVAEDSDMYIVTAPTIGTDQFVRAWILGDAGTANNNQRNVRDQYYSYVDGAATNPGQTDMMLFLGDNAYNSGTDAEYQDAFFDIYDDMLKKSVAWSTLGNHDGYSADSNSQTGPYYDIFTFPTAAEAGGIASGTEAYYSFDYANIHFIVLESYTLSNDNTQETWLTTDIQNTTQDWIVAIFHHPPYTKGSHDSDNVGDSAGAMTNMRTNFLPILEANGVDLVLNGHSHSYERSFFINGHYGTSGTFDFGTHAVGVNGHLSGKADTADGEYTKAPTDTEGAVYITTGSAGKISGGSLDHNAMYASLNQLGSCVLEIEDDGSNGQNMNVKFITDTGSITDYFTINKSGLTLSTGSNELGNNDVKVYPVPANSLLNIDISQGETLRSIKIFDAVGKMVKETANKQINVSTLNSGMYIIQITTNKGEHFKNIIIK